MFTRIVICLPLTVFLLTITGGKRSSRTKSRALAIYQISIQLLSPSVSRQFGWLCASVAT